MRGLRAVMVAGCLAAAVVCAGAERASRGAGGNATGDVNRGTARARSGVSRAPAVATRATTQYGQWVDVGRGVRARAFLGFWGPRGERPGRAARVVRLFPQGQSRGHFGVTLSLQLPQGLTGKLHYEERLLFERPPLIWTRDGAAGVFQENGVRRETSNDARRTVVTQVLTYANGVLQEDDAVEDAGDPVPTNTWDFVEGDPEGIWRVEAWLEQRCVGRFEFDVIRGPAGDTEPVVVPDEELQRWSPQRQ